MPPVNEQKIIEERAEKLPDDDGKQLHKGAPKQYQEGMPKGENRLQPREGDKGNLLEDKHERGGTFGDMPHFPDELLESLPPGKLIDAGYENKSPQGGKPGGGTEIKI